MKKIPTIGSIYLLSILTGLADSEPNSKWSLNEPVRLIQTNLREIDIIDFDVDRYIQDIEEHGANTVLINVGGIVANYPSELPFHYVNPNLKSDIIREVTNGLHAKNIRVIGRFDFSKINEAIAAKHPDWLYVSAKGENVNYNGQVHACLNGAYRQTLKYEILDEVVSRYDLDGIFFNMSGYQVRDYSHNYHGICQSESCRKRFAEWSGGLDLPQEENREDPVFLKYDEFRKQTTSEMFREIRDFIREKAPQMSICTYVDEGVDLRRHESGSQIHRSHEWEYHSTDNVKTILGSYSDKQVSNAAVHFLSFAFRHASVSPHLTEKRLIQNMIHGGGLDFYCIGRLDNQEDRASLKKVSKVFNFHAQNEAYFKNLESPADILLVTSNDWNTQAEIKGFIRFLSERHLQFDMMLKEQLLANDTPKSLSDYALIILPDTANLSDESCRELDQYVGNGGKLLATSLTSTRDAIGNPMNQIRLESLGALPHYDLLGKQMGTYFKLGNQDKASLPSSNLEDIDLMYLYGEFLRCELREGAKGLMRYVPPAMFGPPEKCYYTEISEYPGIIATTHGSGKTVYIPWKIGELYNERSHHGHAKILHGSIIDLLGYEPFVSTDSSPLVEIAYQSSKNGDFSWFGLLNHSGQLNTAFHNPIPMANLSIRLRDPRDPKSVRLQNGNQELEFQRKDEWLEIVVPTLEVFEMVVLQFDS